MNKISERLKKWNTGIFSYILFSVFARYLCYGFTYFHQLDDYIQYWAYPSAENVWQNIVMKQGLLCSRPLAGLSDVYVWGHFFDNMIIAVLIISVLYASSAILFLSVFRKYFKTGFMFTVFYSLMPFFYEGAYWLSASSRIVVGLFFTATSVWILQRFFESGKKRYILPFWLTQLISVCFYEQIFILSMVLNFGMIVLNLKDKDKRRNALLLIILIANAVIYYGITKYFASTSSALGARIKIEYPALTEWYFMFLKDVLTQLKTAFWDAPHAITYIGFVRGLKLIFTDGLWLFALIALALAVVSYAICKNEKIYDEENSQKGLTVFVGLILSVMPIALFFVISNPYICMRNILPSFVGIALILDMVFAYLAKRRKKVMSLFAAGISVLFFVASISETHDYKAVYDFDMLIAQNVKEVINKNDIEGRSAFIIQAGDRGTVNIRFHEHASGVISSDWALCGLLNYINPNGKNENVMPIEVESDSVYHAAWNKDQKLLTDFEKIYYWKNDISEFKEVELNQLNDSVFELVTDDGGVCATVKEHYNVGYILFN